MRPTLRPSQAAVQRVGHVGGRVGGGEVHAVTALHQADRERGGDGGFAHAAFAHDHDEAVARGGEFVGQAAQRLGRQRWGRCRRMGRLGAGRRTTEQRAQRWQAHGVEGAQRHFVTRQSGQAVGHGGQRLLAERFNGGGNRVAGAGRVEHAVDGQALVGQAQVAQLLGGARGFLHGARVGPGDEHHGGQCRVAQGSASAALKRASCIFRPECGPRQEAPRSLPARKPVQALGRLSRRSVWPVGAVSNTMWS